MDQRIMLVALGVAALAFASLSFAAGGQGWAAGNGMQEWNGTAKGQGMMNGGARPEWAGSENCTRALNGTGMPRFNSTEQKAFEAAVESGDFAAATKLHGEYGFGGPMFEKLNATTFAKFSQVHKLQSELMADLGMERGQGMLQGGMRPDGGDGFGEMMRHGIGRKAGQDTNQTQQQ